MKTFHIDEPREIGKKRDRVSSKDLKMVKTDLEERVLRKKIRENLTFPVKSGDIFFDQNISDFLDNSDIF